jgi:hypothetical protein
MIDLELLQDDNTEFIWLYRKNIVEHFLSRTLSGQTGVYNIHNGDVYIPPSELNISKSEIDIFRNVVNCQHQVHSIYKHMFTHELTYEEMFTNNPWNFDDTIPSVDNNTIKLNYYKSEWIDYASSILKDNNIIL